MCSENSKKRDRFLAVASRARGRSCSLTAAAVRAQSSPPAGKQTHLLRQFMLKTIILPRQARDKQRESTQNQMRCRTATSWPRLRPLTARTDPRSATASWGRLHLSQLDILSRPCCLSPLLGVRKAPFLSRFHSKTINSPRQARDRHRKRWEKEEAFSAGVNAPMEEWGDLLLARYLPYYVRLYSMRFPVIGENRSKIGVNSL